MANNIKKNYLIFIIYFILSHSC